MVLYDFAVGAEVMKGRKTKKPTQKRGAGNNGCAGLVLKKVMQSLSKGKY